MDLFRSISLELFQSPFVWILAVQLRCLKIPNMNRQQWHDPAETARPPTNLDTSARRTSLPGLSQQAKDQ